MLLYFFFQTNMISLEALPKIIDTSQLTADLEGTLHYDHASWLETRLAVEEFAWQAADLLDRLDDLQEDLARNDFAEDVTGAKHGIDLHNDMKKKIMKAPVEDLDVLGELLSYPILIQFSLVLTTLAITASGQFEQIVRNNLEIVGNMLPLIFSLSVTSINPPFN